MQHSRHPSDLQVMLSSPQGIMCVRCFLWMSERQLLWNNTNDSSKTDLHMVISSMWRARTAQQVLKAAGQLQLPIGTLRVLLHYCVMSVPACRS